MAGTADPGQQQAAQHGKGEIDAAVVTDQKAARAERTKGIQRRRQIGIREPCALQVFHEIGIEPIGMRIHGGAIDADVPTVIHVDRGIVGEID
ncbi:hypothetical protein [Bradyrhizobium guangzhouense]|uniref:hypothetical protein n=1 Tax=Bradyrhizobium guangzhouense TaxID=1325095 RepID=UPI0013E8B6DD|nr:hypothetical protein [Bradyrhizobium guangzhouense]